MPKDVPHVALLIETSRSYTRDLLRGIRTYIAEHGPWSVYMELRALDSPVPHWLHNWKGDGILTRSASRAMAEAVKETGLPAVELRASRIGHGLPFVGVDNVALGNMVVEHLLELGLSHFGVYELHTESFFQQRCQHVVAALRERGYDCAIFEAPNDRETPLQWEEHQQELSRWLEQLPKPVGLMACTDQLGFWLLDACSRAQIRVPEEAVVVGAENDEALCTMARPRLSSVQYNGLRIGAEAARVLDRMMAGEAPPEEELLIPPLDLIIRDSSDISAITDPLLGQAMRYIRDHACEGIGVEHVLDAVPISRSTLERRMVAAIGRAPNAEILRVRLNRVKQLLRETSLPLAQIAERTGFEHPQYMSHLFKRKVGQTPGAYRAAGRPPKTP